MTLHRITTTLNANSRNYTAKQLFTGAHAGKHHEQKESSGLTVLFLCQDIYIGVKEGVR